MSTTPGRGLWRHALPIGAALLVATAGHLVLRGVAVQEGEDPRRNATWVHWDAYRYIDIARQGYVESPGELGASNTGWFPGYPLLMRLVARAAAVKPAFAGRLIAFAFLVGLLAVMHGDLLPEANGSRIPALLVAGFFPGWVYWHGVFPLSMVVFFSLAAIALGARGLFLAAGLCGALAAFTYPTGFLVAAPLVVEIVLAKGLTPRARLRALVEGPLLAGLGLVAVFALFQLLVGHWDAYLHFHSEYGGKGLFNPLEVLAGHARPLLSPAATPEILVSFQTTLTTLLLVSAVVVYAWQRASMRPVDAALLVHGTVLWLFVNAAGPDVSIYRQASALVSVVPLLVRLRSRALVALLACLLALGAGMAVLFFRDVIV